jgi:FkbH-like protein
MDELIKCLVWDLDNTIWTGTLLEEDSCRLQPGVDRILEELDKRGILLSVASANDADLVVPFLKKNGIYHYFLHPQIDWSNKVKNIQVIAHKLNIALNSVGFIDDEPYELEQVRQLLPEVRTYHAKEYRDLVKRREFSPQFMTQESRQRRKMYIQEGVRAQTQKRSQKSHKEFLKWCKTQITLRRARRSDLPRILELMHRTHQLNATGIIYTTERMESFLDNPDFRVYVAELKDRFMDYGKIGVAICQCCSKKWSLLSFLLSCRVLSRGISFFFLSWLQSKAYQHEASKLEAHYIKRERNYRMRVLYTLSGFKSLRAKRDGSVIFVKNCTKNLRIPDWLTLIEENAG